MRKSRLLSLVILAAMLTGCAEISSKTNAFLSDAIIKHAEIPSDADFEEYEKFSKSGQLDEQGCYRFESTAATPEFSDCAHIIFTENEHLDISYYRDENAEHQIHASDCYLKPGECIYYHVENAKDIPTGTYSFDEFRIYSWESTDGSYKKELLTNVVASDQGLLFKIPEGFEGKELSIEAIGKAGSNLISVQADYHTLSGEPTSAPAGSGVWKCNNNPITGDTVQISPFDSYTITYEYDIHNYFVDLTSPECYSEQNGTVYFDKVTESKSTAQYSVSLYPYFNLSLELHNGDLAYQNGKNLDTASGILSCKMKFNDTVEVYSKSKKAPVCSNVNNLLHTSSKEKSHDGYYLYTYTLNRPTAAFVFNPELYSIRPHGKLKFYISGTLITEAIPVAEGQRIEYEAYDIDAGYHLPDGNRSIVICDERQTKAALDEIKFYPDKEVTVQLNHNGIGGTVLYKLNGQPITDDVISATCGSNIELNFEEWDGWSCALENGLLYTVTENDPQMLMINNKSVFDYFEEKTEHFPVLELNLLKNVGPETYFSIMQVDNGETSYTYQGNHVISTLLGNGYVALKTPIGTGEGITVNAMGEDPNRGSAIRIQLTRSDDSEKHTKEDYRYLTNLPGSVSFDIYEKDEISAPEVTYTHLSLTASLTEIQTFTCPIMEHAKISVKTSNNNMELQSNDIIDDSRYVTVIITPEKGYYLSDAEDESSVIKRMTYKQYLEHIDDLIEQHAAKKYYSITLDSKDSNGSCVFTLDGKEVTGTILAYPGQKLKLEYTVTSEGMEIQSDRDGLGGLLGLLQSKTETTIKIPIEESLDGKTISAQNYITLVKEGSSK